MSKKEQRPDDPAFNFSARSEEFLETFFRKGAEFTEQLLTEAQKMKARIHDLTEENVRLRSQLASDDAVRDLLTKIQKLEDEKHSIRRSADSAQKELEDYADRYEEMEKELDQMANLYVVSSQLHSSINASEVLSVIEQMLMQFVGAAKIGIFLRAYDDNNTPYLKPVHAFHCDEIKGSKVSWNSVPIGETASTGVNYIAEPEQAIKKHMPVACVPMLFGTDCIGVVVIYELLEQKEKFVDVDYELFRLLSQHASSAIVSSGLYARTESVTAALDCFDSL